ncbi:MAG: GIY-YIG nuclease family protein [Bacillota bacterium]
MDKQKRSELMKSYKSRTVVGGVYAVTNAVTGKRILNFTADIQGSRNRFEFAQQMDSCIHPRLKDDWTRLGGDSFRFDIIETLEKKEGQTDSEFQEDLKSLFDIASDGVQPDRYE